MSWVFSVARGVHILLYPALTGLPDSLVALIDRGGCRVMVDSGCGAPGSISALTLALAYLKVKRGSVRFLVLTHAHLPSSGGAYWVRDTLSTIVAAAEPDASWVERGDRGVAAGEYGLPFNPVPVGLRLSEGPLPGCSDVKVMMTPGHTPGSVTVYTEDPGRGVVAFVGDALGRLSSDWGSSEGDWVRSVERIRSLEPEVLCTSVQCLEGRAARSLLEEAISRGPEWVGGH